MRVLVTGASGFVGQHLLPRLKQAGWNVSSHAHGSDQPWPSTLDAVVHLAGRAHVLHETHTDPLEPYRQANVHYSLDCARRAIAAGAQRFVYLSSAKVLGESAAPERPMSDECLPQPQDDYSRSKWEAEQRLRELLGERLVVLRPCLIYGPGVKANFAALLNWSKGSLPLPLANVHNQRSLLFVGNLTDAIHKVLTHPHAGGQCYLLSDDDTISTPELLRTLAQAQGRQATLFSAPPWLLKAGARLLGRGPQLQRLLGNLCVDSSKIRRELGWQPPYRLHSALALTAKSAAEEGSTEQ